MQNSQKRILLILLPTFSRPKGHTIMRFSTKLSYGIGQMSDGIKHISFTVFLFFYYNQVLGLSGTLTGLGAMLALIVDAITDPMIGQLSDRYNSKWGRRHPFMLAGGLSFGFAIAMLFSPPVNIDNHSLFFWMLGWAICTRLLLTLFFVPHLALGAEIVKDYHERTSLIGYRVFFASTGQLITLIIGFFVFFPPPLGMLNASGYATFGIFAGFLGSFVMLLSTIMTKHTIPKLSVPKINNKTTHPLLGFVAVFFKLKHYSFRILFFATTLFMVIAGITQTLLIHVGTFLFNFEPQEMGILATSMILGIIFAPSVAKKLSITFDKKEALCICVFLGAAIAFIPHDLFILGILQQLDLNTRLMCVYLSNGISQAFFIAYIILIDSMLSDTIDENEMNTGRREEGLYFSARSLATKASYGLGSFFAGIGMDFIDFPQNALPDEISTIMLNKLAILAGPFSMILFLCTILITIKYPLNAMKHAKIRATIDDKNDE